VADAAAHLARQLQVVDLRLPGLEVFKAVGNERSLVEYAAAHPPRVNGDWSAVYTQLDRHHSLGTVPYRWDMGYNVARLIRSSLSDARVLVVDAPWMPDGQIDMAIKAEAVRRVLQCSHGLRQDMTLMDAVGELGVLLCCRETADQWEIVVPHQLLSELKWDTHVLMELQQNKYGATGQCRENNIDDQDGGRQNETWGSWRRFEDTEALCHVPVPLWICEALGRS
jgi:hypothetical protein